MSAITEGQLEVGGLVCGPGTDYLITGLAVYDLPAVTNDDIQDPSGYGIIPGPLDRYTGSLISIEIAIKTAVPTPEALRAAMDALSDALVVWKEDATVLFRWIPPGYTGKGWRHSGRNRKLAWVDNTFQFGWVVAKLQFQSFSAARLSDDLHSAVTSLPVSSGGRTYPRVYPLVYPGIGTPGAVTLTNTGNLPADFIARIDGPCTSPTILMVGPDGTPYQMTFDIPLALGDFLQVDSGAATVLLNGVTNRQNSIRAGTTWFRIPPGSSVARFVANAYDPNAMLTIAWRDTRL